MGALAASGLGSERRRIGPLGTTARVAAGSLLIAATAAGGLRAWDVAGALILIPAMAALAPALLARASRRGAPAWLDPDRPMQHPGAGFLLVAVAIGAATAVTFATPVDAGAIWLFLGISLLVAALRGDDGCEVLALANAITGREDTAGCPVLTPVDRAEARRHPR